MILADLLQVDVDCVPQFSNSATDSWIEEVNEYFVGCCVE